MIDNKNVDYDLFKKTIENRITIINSLIEEVGYLSYDINPIGLFDSLKETMFKNGLESIENIQSKLNEIKQSYINCIKT